MNKNDSKYKAIYQDYNWCYQKFIIEGLNHQEMADECGASKRVIEKWCTEKHRLTQKYRQENKQLNETQRSLIIGSMMGDGHIDNRETQPLFIVSHAENQKDYLYWKYDILKDLCNKEPSYIKPKVKPFGEKKYISQPAYRICTRIYDCLLEIRNMSIFDLLDNFDELALSIAILDDGYRDKCHYKDGRGLWSYCISPYNQLEKDYIIKTLKEKFNINSYVTKDNEYLKFDIKDSGKIDDIILRNIPNDLDIIKYKIGGNTNE